MTTYREKLKEIIGNNPNVFSAEFESEVKGCPNGHFDCKEDICDCDSTSSCDHCWRQEYKGEEYIGNDAPTSNLSNDEIDFLYDLVDYFKADSEEMEIMLKSIKEKLDSQSKLLEKEEVQ